jgi:hypothetical protein
MSGGAEQQIEICQTNCALNSSPFSSRNPKGSAYSMTDAAPQHEPNSFSGAFHGHFSSKHRCHLQNEAVPMIKEMVRA